jgi:hypothetical protein
MIHAKEVYRPTQGKSIMSLRDQDFRFYEKHLFGFMTFVCGNPWVVLRCGFCPVLQSAYRRYHSTETALLKVLNDILLSMNSQRATLLVLLDLSSAFDTMDHSPINQNFELNKSRQKFHHSLKEHHKISNITKFRCKML